jgi:ankyrin repeat protein
MKNRVNRAACDRLVAIVIGSVVLGVLGCTPGVTPLHRAAWVGDVSDMRALLANGIAVDTRDSYGRTPLCYAADGGKTVAIAFLIGKGAHVDAHAKSGWTALMAAANAETVRLLLKEGADPNARCLGGGTALHFLVLRDDLHSIELLVEHGANVNAATVEGETPLHWAAQGGDKHIVAFLLSHGASPNVVACEFVWVRVGPPLTGRLKHKQLCWTPLHIAAAHGERDAVELLIKYGADVNVRDADGMSPLHCAVARVPGVASEPRLAVARVLVANGAFVSAKDRLGRTPLHLVASDKSQGTLTFAEFLVGAGAYVHASDNEGKTAKDRAREYHGWDSELFRFLERR